MTFSNFVFQQPIRTGAITLDGSMGEGGGQILRSGLSLSMLTGRPLRIHSIRAGRAKPGLMRQHLVCVQAARAMAGAHTQGAELGSQTLEFTPAALTGGSFEFDIGSAGSCMLVLQTLLPAMLALDVACAVTLRGGTHNPLAPSADFFQACFLPQLAALGAHLELTVPRLGLAPAGCGAVTLRTEPNAELMPLSLLERAGECAVGAHAIVAGVPRTVAEREIQTLRQHFQHRRAALRTSELRISDAPGTGPGNVLGLTLAFENVAEHITEFGARGVAAEQVAENAVRQAERYLGCNAPVGEYLADQLLLPMLLAGGGEFITGTPSEHLRTNALVIEAFGVAKIAIAPVHESARLPTHQQLWRVRLAR